jgi:hypothetical protein
LKDDSGSWKEEEEEEEEEQWDNNGDFAYTATGSDLL